MDEAQRAEFYNRKEDVSAFDEGAEVWVKVKRDVTTSVRFSEDEIRDLRSRAEQAGVTSIGPSSDPLVRHRVDQRAVQDAVHDLFRHVG